MSDRLLALPCEMRGDSLPNCVYDTHAVYRRDDLQVSRKVRIES
jgi:hypothetical protein